jgi:hypothetical protein
VDLVLLYLNLNLVCLWSDTWCKIFLLFTDVFCFLFQNSRKQPTILNYFSEICSLDDELTNDLLAGIDFEESESFEKRPKLN